MRAIRNGRLGVLLALLIALAFGAACGDDDVVVASDDFTVACYKATVWSGGPGVTVLPKLDDCSFPSQPASSDFIALNKGGFVTTDENGQANVRTNSCGTIYVFENGDLTVSPCTKSQSQGVCTLNTAAWRSSCGGDLKLETLSSSISLEGTWVGINYLPDSQATLVTVFEGEARVTPFAVVEGVDEVRRLFGDGGDLAVEEFTGIDVPETAPAQSVGAGFAYVTAPDAQLERLAERLSFPVRESIPLAALPRVADELGLGSQLDLILEQAEIDGIDLGAFGLGAINPGAIILTTEGGPLDEPEITAALVDSVEWLQFAELAPEGMFSIPRAGGFVDLLALPWSPEAAELGQARLAEAGMEELRIVIAREDDGGLFGVAELLFVGDGAFAGLRQLAGADIEAYGGLEEAQRVAAGYAERGIPVVLLYRAEG